MTISHDNLITFTGKYLSKVEAIDGSVVITPGQPYTWPPVINQSGIGGESTETWNVTFTAGRSGSTTVASQLSTDYPDPHAWYVTPVYSEAYDGAIPTTLNFYFNLRLTFSTPNDAPTTQTTITVAQGSASGTLSNYWWLVSGPFVLNSCPDGGASAFVLFPNIDAIVATTGAGSTDDFFAFTLEYQWE